MTNEEISDNWEWLCDNQSRLKEDMRLLIAYCRYYKVSADWLLGLADTTQQSTNDDMEGDRG